MVELWAGHSGVHRWDQVPCDKRLHSVTHPAGLIESAGVSQITEVHEFEHRCRGGDRAFNHVCSDGTVPIESTDIRHIS
jgi:hypothetical protein